MKTAQKCSHVLINVNSLIINFCDRIFYVSTGPYLSVVQRAIADRPHMYFDKVLQERERGREEGLHFENKMRCDGEILSSPFSRTFSSTLISGDLCSSMGFVKPNSCEIGCKFEFSFIYTKEDRTQFNSSFLVNIKKTRFFYTMLIFEADGAPLVNMQILLIYFHIL